MSTMDYDTWRSITGCLNKQAYHSRKIAKDIAALARKKTGNPNIVEYRCQNCMYWHIGHDNKHKRKA
jgi:hypothetical protein